MDLNSSSTTRPVTIAYPTLTFPGFALAYSTTSLSDLAGNFKLAENCSACVVNKLTGVKLLIGSYGSAVYNAWFIVSAKSTDCKRVYPSGGDLATSCAPITPLAPGRLSM